MVNQTLMHGPKVLVCLLCMQTLFGIEQINVTWHLVTCESNVVCDMVLVFKFRNGPYVHCLVYRLLSAKTG